jgi:hypothetical protein
LTEFLRRTMHITIDEIDGRIHLHSFGQRLVARPGGHLQPWWAGTDAWRARSFMDRYFRDTGRLHVLRHALTLDGHDGFDLARHSDDEVLQTAARRVASGTWKITREVAPAPGVARSVPTPAPSPLLGGGSSVGSTRSSRRPASPVSRAPVRARAPAASVPADASDWPDTSAQVAQAETLKLAARDGTPFCEICDARRRAAEEAAA